MFSNSLEIDLSDLKFLSTDHIRYQNGVDVSGHNFNCKRGIKIETNINGDVGYTVTMHNMDGNHPVWGDNIQMAPKQMKIIDSANSKTVLRGFGQDAMGSPFSDYGITIYHPQVEVDKIVLHMHDRGVDIEYLK